MKTSMNYAGLILGLCFLLSCGQNRTKTSNDTFGSMTKPDYSSKEKLTGEERKRRTNAFLKKQNVATLEHLPLVEDFTEARFRDEKEISKRCVVLYGIVFVVHGEASGEEMVEYFKEFGLWGDVSPNERKFLENKKVSEKERIEYSWKVECLNVLLWSLKKFEELDLPIDMCDFEHIEDLPDLSVDPTPWIERSHLRNKEEILNEVDLIYRIHWATRDAELNSRDIPGNFNPGIVFERHYALNWVVMYADEWDEITTDT